MSKVLPVAAVSTPPVPRFCSLRFSRILEKRLSCKRMSKGLVMALNTVMGNGGPPEVWCQDIQLENTWPVWCCGSPEEDCRDSVKVGEAASYAESNTPGPLLSLSLPCSAGAA